MKRTCLCLIMLVSVALLFVSSSNAQISKRQISTSTKVVAKPTLLDTKIAFQESLQKLDKSYQYFKKNPRSDKTRLYLNKALDDAVIKAKSLVNMAKEQGPQEGPPPPPPKPGPQGPQGGSKGDTNLLLDTANSLLGDLTRVRSISSKTMSASLMNTLSTKMNIIKGKNVSLALLEPKAEP